ncbi:unnamed protein product [Effrenium voratum]|nr:unnamed protein product [Effrenium voratum]
MTASANAIAAAAVAQIRATPVEALAQRPPEKGYPAASISEAERAVLNSPYALGYLGAGELEEEEGAEIDYGEYALSEGEAFEDEIIRPKPRKDQVTEYVVDNTELQADAPGVAFRFSCVLEDRDERRPVALWGSIVAGEEAEGWVRVGDRFLPHEVNGKTVLVPRGPSKFRAEGRLEDLDDEEAEEEGADSVPWRDQKEPGSARKPRETPEQRRQRVLREEEERVRDKEHEEQERRSKELLRKHRQLLQQGSSHYTALSVHRTASLEEIHEAYRKLCKVFHPDRADEKNERAARHRIMAQLTEAYGVLSCPTKRWAYDRSLPGEMEEPAPGPVALERGSVDDGQDGDFDFSGDGRPFRFCKGKAARVAKACGSREGVRLVMHQLLGKEPMELAECGGVVRHVGPMSPLGGLGECGSANCLAHRLRSPELRNGFRDFVVSKVGEPFFSAAWILASWPAECFKPPSLQRVEHPLLSRPEDSSRLRLLARDLRLEVWRVTCKPRIPVRAAPAASAEIVEVFYANDEVLVAEVKAPWLKVAKEHWQTDAPEAAWVLQDGSAFGLGPLLERI